MKTIKGKGNPSEMALYWFTKWYEQKHGHPYPFTSAMQVARDAGINSNTASRAIKNAKLIRLAGNELVVED